MKSKFAKYRLSGRQVEAIFNHLYRINLIEMERDGKINIVDDDISPEDGKVISDLFYDDNFIKEIEND